MITATYKLFRFLAGNWKLQRSLSAAGTVVGSACFAPIATDILHYQEGGIFTNHMQKTFRVNREYGYRYDATQDSISVYFMRNGNLDYLFHELVFAPKAQNGILTASGRHACRDDMYYAYYEFINELRFIITFEVLGPNKNYISRTVFDKDLTAIKN